MVKFGTHHILCQLKEGDKERHSRLPNKAKTLTTNKKNLGTHTGEKQWLCCARNPVKESVANATAYSMAECQMQRPTEIAAHIWGTPCKVSTFPMSNSKLPEETAI